MTCSETKIINEARETGLCNTFCPKLAECDSMKYFFEFTELVAVSALHFILFLAYRVLYKCLDYSYHFKIQFKLILIIILVMLRET